MGDMQVFGDTELLKVCCLELAPPTTLHSLLLIFLSVFLVHKLVFFQLWFRTN